MAAILLAAVCCYVLAWPNAPVLTSDSSSYMRLAQEMSRFHLQELSLRTPGFPLLLILTQAAEHPTRLLYVCSLSLHMAAVAVLAYLSFLLGGSRPVTFLFVGLSILPPFVEPCASVLAEAASQYTVVFALASLVLWILYRKSAWLVLFVVMVALAVQIRPTYSLMGPLFLACAGVLVFLRVLPGIRPRRLMLWLVFASLCSFGTQLAWSYCNYASFGYFGANRLQPFQLGTKTYDYVEALPEERKELREILVRHRDRNMAEPFTDHTGKDFLYRAFPEVRALYGDDLVKTTTELTRALTELIKHKPMSYLNNSLRAFPYFWTPNECSVCGPQAGWLRLAWAGIQMLVLAVFFVTAFALAGAGLIFAAAFLLSGRAAPVVPDGRTQVLAFLLTVSLALVFYTAIISSFAATGLPRYRQSVDLLILLCVTLGLLAWRDISLWFLSLVRGQQQAD